MEHNNKLYLTTDESVLFDNNYRYQISIIQSSIVLKKGTNIMVLDNFEQFCKELMFDPQLFIKIIGKELSCKSGMNKTNQYYLQGQYTSFEIKQVVYDFIQKHLLCISCDKPEINLKYKKGKIKQKCRACGNNTYLENVKDEIVHALKNL